MKYISFSLWGDKPIYNIGMIRNVELSKILYPDWKVVVCYDKTVPIQTLNVLQDLEVKLINFSNSNLYGMFWRFSVSDLDDCDYVIFRDSDSRLSVREKLAVDEWIESKKSLHVMRDHPYHKIPAGNNKLGILGGMWGIKGGLLNMTKLIYEFDKSTNHTYGNDQTFLKKIYDIFEKDRCTHDDFFEKHPFPIKREYGRFIGERIDENDKPVGDDYKLIL